MKTREELINNILMLSTDAYINSLKEEFKELNINIAGIIENMNSLLGMIIGEKYELAVYFLERTENLLSASTEKNSIRIIDILKFEIVPKLELCLS